MCQPSISVLNRKPCVFDCIPFDFIVLGWVVACAFLILSFLPSLAYGQQRPALDQNQILPALVDSQITRQTPTRLPVRFRFTWGGGESKQWAGVIKFADLSISEMVLLGLDPNTPGSILPIGNEKGNKKQELRFQSKSATAYAGFDIDVVGDLESLIEFQVYSIDAPEQKQTHRIKLQDALRAPVSVELDDAGNRFTVKRAPGDELRCRFNREHLIFDAREKFDLELAANRTSLSDGVAVCKLNLRAARSEAGSTSFWNRSMEIPIGAAGASAWNSVAIDLPSKEGVYDLQIELFSQSSVNAIHALRRPVVTRVVQLVVLNNSESELAAKTAGPTQPHPPRITISPPDFVQSGGGRNQFNQLFQNASSSITQVKTVSSAIGGVVEMPRGGWQAIPLRIPSSESDQPHVLEIDYPLDRPMKFGISVLQQDAAGQVPLFGFDSGVHVANTLVPASDSSKRGTTKLTFWPGKKTTLLIANRDDQRSARFGEIRIRRKSEKGLVQQQNRLGVNRNQSRRQFMAFYELPMFPEQFGASKVLDSNLKQPVDDWLTFYQGAQRLVNQLVENGYTGAFINVACDGSALFPSPTLQPTARFDTGVFCSSGRDPIRKDVLELLYRMFERNGLRLVPALTFNDTLPAVEKSANEGGSASHQLVNFRNESPALSLSPDLPEYNPLSPAVQRSVAEIVEEVVQRYRSRSGFVGLAVLCRPDTVGLLPGRHWGCDDETIGAFENSLAGDSAQLLNDASSFVEKQTLLLQDLLEPWAEWRATRMSDWYESIANSISEGKQSAKLYLAPVDPFRETETAAELSPSLHRNFNVDGVMKGLGFSSKLLRNESICMLKPHRLAPTHGLASQRVEFAVEDSRQLDGWMQAAEFQGDIFVNRATWAHFQQLENRQPFSKQTFPLMRMHQLAPAGDASRARFAKAMVRSDSRMLVDGGWVMNLGEETSLRSLVSVFSQLPSQKFNTVELADAAEKTASGGLVVREFFDGDSSYFYMVNATPWPVQINLPFTKVALGEQKEPDVRFVSLGNGRLNVINDDANRKRLSISHSLEPYGIVGGVSTGQQIRFEPYRFEFPAEAGEQLRKSYYELRSNLIRSGKVKPLESLSNSGFEQLSQQNLVGWSIGDQDSKSFQFDSRNPKTGINSLLIKNEASESVWVRSNPFTAPTTGRLSVSVWLRTDSKDSQPPLRISVEGASIGSGYYRFGSVGSLSTDVATNQITTEWKRFGIHFDDLPIEEVGNVRIGFDMMGEGTVWIDECEVYDRWFDENDTKALTQLLASAGLILEQHGDVQRSHQILTSYWPTFLREHFSQSATEQNIARQAKPAGERTSSFKRRLRRLRPNRVLPYR